MLLQIVVAQGEVVAAEEPVVGREGRRMRTFEHAVFAPIDEHLLVAGVASPKQEDDVRTIGGKRLDGSVGECLPTLACMTVGHASLHGERSVEQQDALVGPCAEVAAVGQGRGTSHRPWIGTRHHHGRLSELAHQFLVDVEQRRREGNARLHREAQAMSLPRFVIGILSEDDNLHLVERRAVEGFEDEASGRIARRGLVGTAHEVGKYLKIRAVELWLKLLAPRFLNLDLHSKTFSNYLALIEKCAAKIDTFSEKNKSCPSFYLFFFFLFNQMIGYYGN